MPASVWSMDERFEKLVPFLILGFRRNFLKSVKRSVAADQPFAGLRNYREVLEGSGFVPEPSHGRLKIGAPFNTQIDNISAVMSQIYTPFRLE